MKSSYDIVIIGGGMVGATLACALGNSPLKVALLERAPVPVPTEQDHDPRVSAVSLAARALFENLGVWSDMERRRVARVAEMYVWGHDDGGAIHFDAAEIGEPALAYIIENSVIQAALIARLHQFTNVHWLCPVDIGAIELADNAALVSLADGRHVQAKLLVGADGAESAVRRAARIETQSLDLKQKGIVATVTTEKPHAATARQVFLSSGPLAFLPLAAPNACSIVWSADNARADQLLALGDGEFTAALRQAFGGSLGAIQQVGARAAFPLALAHARAYTAPHLALVGDAAHSVHPLAGQGVNLGFLDAATLAEVLLDAVARHKDIGAHATLRRYERWRKADNLTTISVTGGFKYFFGNTWPVLTSMRGWGMNLADRVAPIKHFIMRRASGLEGDLPKLARRNRL